MRSTEECVRRALEAATLMGTLSEAIRERDAVIEQLRADNVKLAAKCDSLSDALAKASER